jgi:DNA-binding transcriptional MerR regulator
MVARRTVMRQLRLPAELLDRLEELQVLVPVRRKGGERAYPIEDLEHLRVYRLLVEELGVNPAGAEIILRLRSQMLGAQRRLVTLLGRMRSEGLLDDLRELLSSFDDRLGDD